MKLTEEQKSFILQYYPEKGSQYCQQQLRIPNIRSIEHWVHKNKIKKQKYDYVSDFWPITAKSAYTLGFITGDGCVELRKNVPIQIFIGINEKDGLELYNNCFNFTKWHIYYPKNRSNTQQQIKFAIHNKVLCSKFVDFNLHIKSQVFPVDLFNSIPYQYKHYFLLGFFDADGSISYRNKSHQPTLKFAGPYDFDWSPLQLFIKSIFPEIDSYVGLYCNKTKNHRHSQLAIHKNTHCYKLSQYMYQNYHIDNIGLKRKYDKFNALRAKFD